VESPLAQLFREKKASLSHTVSAQNLPVLPKLKLGKPKGLPRSKSQGNLRQPAAVEVPPTQTRSATSSPHAASSAGSEPVRIDISQRRRRTQSVDWEHAGPHPGDDAQQLVSTPVISAASSLLGHHLNAGLASAAASGSLNASPTQAALQLARTHSVSRELYEAQADAVMAHATVQSLQSALRKEQDEVQRLREQLELMTAERDRLLAELQQGGDASFFVLDRASMDIQYRQRQAAAAERQRAEAAAAALHRAPLPTGRTAAEALAGGPAAAGGGQPPRPRSGLRTMFRLPS
jgi:hypothetical protein